MYSPVSGHHEHTPGQFSPVDLGVQPLGGGELDADLVYMLPVDALGKPWEKFLKLDLSQTGVGRATTRPRRCNV